MTSALPIDLAKRLELAAVTEDCDMQDIVQAALVAYLPTLPSVTGTGTFPSAGGPE